MLELFIGWCVWFVITVVVINVVVYTLALIAILVGVILEWLKR